MTEITLPSDIATAIRARSSWRSYDERPIDAEVRDRFKQAIASPPAAPFGTEVKLTLLESFDAKQRGVEKLGTYGVIKGASNYLVGVVPETERSLEDYGYVFEWALLVATEMGLATCWLGGTFKRGAFGQAVGCGPDEFVPAVSPVGYARSRRTIVDSTFRFFAKSKQRKQWEQLFFGADASTPLQQASAGAYAEVLELLRLGPSASNKQPWRIVADLDRRSFALFLKRTPGYRQQFTADLQRVDMGIAMCHFAMAARALGLQGAWGPALPEELRAPEGTTHVATWSGEAP